MLTPSMPAQPLVFASARCLKAVALVGVLVATAACSTQMVPSSMQQAEGSNDRFHGAYVVESLGDGGWAALEDAAGHLLHLPRAWLPIEAREGDVISASVRSAEGGRAILLTLDVEATEQRRLAMEERHRRLPRGPSGDLEL